MAEIALHLALRKIDVAIGQADQYSTKVGLFKFLGKLRRIKSELCMVKCFLEQLETRYNNNQLHVSWIDDAQKLGSRVEDTVDEYIHKHFRPSDLETVKHLRVLLLDENLAPLEELEVELERLSKRKKLWFQVYPTDMGAYTSSTRDRENSSISSHQVPYSVDKEPDGFNSIGRDSLREQLQSQRNMARPVVAIVLGPPGSGKTALVRFEFERQRRHFDSCQWISMAGCSSAQAILIKMRRELCLQGDTIINDEDTVERSIYQLRESLANKKFLIVFDDLLVASRISEVARILPSGSCLIINTRLDTVASQVASEQDGQNNIVDLAALHDKSLQQDSQLGEVPVAKEKQDSQLRQLQQLFDGVDAAKRAGTSSNGQPDTNVSKLHPCLFLPQVTVSLRASVLSSGNQNTESAVKEMKKQLTWVWEHNLCLNDTAKCLYVAYINLPMHLKVCLLYCGIFPAGHLLQRDKLVRLFVAEGFIEKQRESEEEEDIAEGYLVELTRWGFLHPVDSYELGRVASLRMPIVVHELVQSISRKEGFGVASNDVELPRRGTGARCLYYSKYPQDIICSLVHLPHHIRTLIFGASPAATSNNGLMKPPRHPANSTPDFLYYAIGCLRFKPTDFLYQQNLSGLPTLDKKGLYVTVLELTGYPSEVLPTVIGELFNLRYLGLRKSKIKRLPAFISHLYNMQALDLELSGITKLPDWIYKLRRLRHLLAGSLLKGVVAPSNVKYLKQLQTLETVETSAKFLRRVDMLTQLRSLCISNVDINYCKTLFVNTSKLQFLSRLSVSAKHENDEVLLDELHSNKIKYIEFSCCKLGEDALKRLSDKLPQLVSLSCHNVTGITKLAFQENWFIELRALNLREMIDVKELRIPGSALGRLGILHVESLENLNMEGGVNDLDKIRSITHVFFPQLKDRLQTNAACCAEQTFIPSAETMVV